MTFSSPLVTASLSATIAPQPSASASAASVPTNSAFFAAQVLKSLTYNSVCAARRGGCAGSVISLLSVMLMRLMQVIIRYVGNSAGNCSSCKSWASLPPPHTHTHTRARARTPSTSLFAYFSCHRISICLKFAGHRVQVCLDVLVHLGNAVSVRIDLYRAPNASGNLWLAFPVRDVDVWAFARLAIVCNLSHLISTKSGNIT